MNYAVYRDDQKYVTLSNLIHFDLYEYALLKCIDEKTKNAMFYSISPETRQYMELNATHRRDNRSVEAFSSDLAINKTFTLWVIDYFHYIFKSDLCECGCDALETLDTDKTITYFPDLKDSKECLYELVHSTTSYWRDTNYLDLRDNKFEDLRKLSYQYEVYIIAVDAFTRKFKFIRVTPDMKAEDRIIKAWGGKKVKSIKINEVDFHDIPERHSDIVMSHLLKPFHRRSA